jgi:hypothetical protein
LAFARKGFPSLIVVHSVKAFLQLYIEFVGTEVHGCAFDAHLYEILSLDAPFSVAEVYGHDRFSLAAVLS